MEVGQKALDSFEWVRWINIRGCSAGMRAEVRGGFQDTGGSGAHGDDPSCGGNFLFEARSDFIPFLVHGMVTEVGGFDGAEGAQPDMESQKSMVELGEEFRGEMQAGRGGRHGSRDFRVGSLVGDEVLGIKIRSALGLAPFQNVRRKRGATEGIEVEFFHQGANHDLAARDGFFHTEKRGPGWWANQWVRIEIGAGGESFGRGT